MSGSASAILDSSAALEVVTENAQRSRTVAEGSRGRRADRGRREAETNMSSAVRQGFGPGCECINTTALSTVKHCEVRGSILLVQPQALSVDIRTFPQRHTLLPHNFFTSPLPASRSRIVRGIIVPLQTPLLPNAYHLPRSSRSCKIPRRPSLLLLIEASPLLQSHHVSRPGKAAMLRKLILCILGFC